MSKRVFEEHLRKVMKYFGGSIIDSRVLRSIAQVFVLNLFLVGCISEGDISLPANSLFSPQITAPDREDVSFDKGVFEVELKANVDFDCEVNGNWIQVDRPSDGLLKNPTMAFEVSENLSRKDRKGEIVFFSSEFGVSDTLVVVQGGNPDFVKVASPIDLGLSVKWAGWNIGAEQPEDFGGYYAWGEIKEKDCYSLDTYKFRSESKDSIIKYSITYGGDNKTHLDPEDDVAHVVWGDQWRMPTLSEIHELVEDCSWESVESEGVSGYKVTGPNKQSIFIPMAGYRFVDKFEKGSFDYWSSTLCTSPGVSPDVYAYVLGPKSSTVGNYHCRYDCGLPVRPVYGEAAPRITVATGELLEVSAKGARLSGTVNNADEPIECGILYSTSYSGVGEKVATTADGDFSLSVEGLLPDTEYYYRAYAHIKEGGQENGRYEYGEIRSFRTKVHDVVVTTGEATDIRSSVVTLNGVVDGAEAALDCGFMYGTSADLSWEDSEVVQISANENKDFSLQISGLEEDTEYYYRAFATVGDEHVYGEVRSFRTKLTISVTTGEATDITDSGVTLGGTVIHSEDSLTCGIIYGISSTLSDVDGTMLPTTSNGEYSITLSGLEANTTYYYRAYVVADGKNLYGEVRSFKTGLSVVTGAATDITDNGAVLSGTVHSGGQSVACGIEYATSSTFTNGTTKSTTSNGEYSIALSGLEANTTYYYRAYVVADGKNLYGEVRSFKTGLSVVTGEATDITDSGAVLSGTVRSGGKSVTCGIEYATSSTFTNGTRKSTTSNGEYSFTLSGLEANTTYYYRAYVVADGKNLYGEVRSFKTGLSVITGAATNITYNGAVLSGTVRSGGKSVTCGIEYATSSTFTNGTTKSTRSNGEYSITLSGLEANTTYYYRAYVVADGKNLYGEVKSFIHTNIVDLGLSVKWASCNVGATSPEEYGGCYAWGETEEKSDYSWATYKWCNGSSHKMTKYCTNSGYGTVDGKTTLDPEDDVAHVKWGGDWRMPTQDEIMELCNNCSWEWTSVNGVDGQKVTGPNGNSIFLPAAGFRNGTEVYDRGLSGCYWSLREGYNNIAFGLTFDDGRWYWGYNGRDSGFFVRPVTK